MTTTTVTTTFANKAGYDLIDDCLNLTTLVQCVLLLIYFQLFFPLWNKLVSSYLGQNLALREIQKRRGSNGANVAGDENLSYREQIITSYEFLTDVVRYVSSRLLLLQVHSWAVIFSLIV